MVPWSTDDEVVALANDCPFGLGSNVFSGSQVGGGEGVLLAAGCSAAVCACLLLPAVVLDSASACTCCCVLCSLLLCATPPPTPLLPMHTEYSALALPVLRHVTVLLLFYQCFAML